MAEYTKDDGTVIGAADDSALDRELARSEQWSRRGSTVPAAGSKSEAAEVSMTNTRAELEQAAADAGLENLERFVNKQELLDAILSEQE